MQQEVRAKGFKRPFPFQQGESPRRQLPNGMRCNRPCYLNRKGYRQIAPRKIASLPTVLICPQGQHFRGTAIQPAPPRLWLSSHHLQHPPPQAGGAKEGETGCSSAPPDSRKTFGQSVWAREPLSRVTMAWELANCTEGPKETLMWKLICVKCTFRGVYLCTTGLMLR